MSRRVLRTIPVFYPYVSGPANQAARVSRDLAGLGWDSYLVTTTYLANASIGESMVEGVRTRRLRAGLGVMAYRCVNDPFHALDQKPELVHAHEYRNRLTTLARRFAKRESLPYVLQPHGGLSMFRYLFSGIGRVPYRLFDLATRGRDVLEADAVILATEQERQEAISFGVDPDRTDVIPVGIDVPDDPPLCAEVGESFEVLFVGRINPGRNVEQLLRAAAAVRTRFRRRLIVRVVGPFAARSGLERNARYEGALRGLVADLNLQDMVRLEGPLSGRALRDAYLRADVFVYPSRYENFGQTMLEAASHGLPLLVTRTGVASDLVEDGQTGYFVDLDDIEGLADRIVLLGEDEPKRRAMSARLRELVRERYAWPAVVGAYERLYRRLVSASSQ